MSGYAKIRRKLQEALAGDFDERHIAGGFAVGVFFSFTPLLSLHMALAFLVALLFRLSKGAALAGCWVNNPYTMPFVFYGSFRLGEKVLGVTIPPPEFTEMTLATLFRAAAPYAAPLFVGSALVGAVAAAAAYLIVYRAAAGVKSARRKAQKD